MSSPADRPLLLHVMHRFATGGLENGVVNLINRMPAHRWRHGVLALTGVDEAFRRRVRHDDVVFVSLDKKPGHLIRQYPSVYRLLRQLRPAVVHTRNLAALEVQLPAWAAGSSARIHGEHGWDVYDPAGTRLRYMLLRRIYAPFVQQFVTVSADLENYLVHRVGIAAGRVEQLMNGVDAERFAPAPEARASVAGCPFVDPALWLVGTIGRQQPIKDQTNLARAFVAALRLRPQARQTMRLVIVGEGPLRAEAGCAELAWLPGERADVPDVLRGLDLFVLPSLAEGISNTILEAMATGLPVVATAVGGNPELVADGRTGTLVPPADSGRLAEAILRYFDDRELQREHGQAGRQRVEQCFSLDRMVDRYELLYQRVLTKRGFLVPSRAV